MRTDIFLSFTVIMLCAAAVFTVRMQQPDEQATALLRANIIEVQREATPTPIPLPCDLFDKLNNEDDEKLAALELKVGDQEIEYFEDRLALSGSGLTITQLRSADPPKEIGLKVLHTDTCTTEVVVISKIGDELIAPPGWRIEPVTRQNGITWNSWNTDYEISSPANSVVLKNKYPTVTHKTVATKVKTRLGLTKTVRESVREIEYRTYAPYSRAVHRPEVVEMGRQYLNVLVENAYAELRKNKVRSHAFPDQLVVDVPVFSRASFERLPIIEHNDLAEFMADPRRTSERVLVLLGLNGPGTFAYTCSGASACGLYQYTDNGRQGTYSTIRKKYPQAKLDSNFEKAARDHLNIAQAAILLYDNNLAYLVGKYGDELVKDPRLEEYLAAMYNASPKSVIKSLDPALKHDKSEWADGLLVETKGYIVKLRYLIENNFFTPSVMQPPIKG